LRILLVILFSSSIYSQSISLNQFEKAINMAKKAACLAYKKPSREGSYYPQYFYIFRHIFEALESPEDIISNSEGPLSNCSDKRVTGYEYQGKIYLCESLKRSSLMGLVQTIIHEVVHVLDFYHSEEQTREVELATMAISIGAYEHYKYAGIELDQGFEDILPRHAVDMSREHNIRKNLKMRNSLGPGVECSL